MAETVPFNFYLVFEAKESRHVSGRWEACGAPRATVRKPAVNFREVAVKMNVDLPASLFSRPALNFKLSVPEPEQQVVIDAETQQGIADIIAEQIGVRVVVSAGDAE